MAEQHDRILGYFLEEAGEHLKTIEQGLRKLPETVRQPTMIRELFRAAHSIKGSAAMLGLVDVQKIGNQFEANFRLLKEQPQIAVDNQLQSLFLESFRFLEAGINDVRIARDPYHHNSALGDPIGDPVFEELKSYLHHLVAAAESVPSAPTSERNSKDPALEQIFGEYVTRKLDEIIGLCLQPDCPEIRTQIQQICQKLGNLGENFEFLEWTNLFTACRLAIANPINLLPRLGESMSIAVKQAQVLVLADRHQAIGVTPDLEALINHRPTQGSDVVAIHDAAKDQTESSTWILNYPSDLAAEMAIASGDPTQKLADLVSINADQVDLSTTELLPLNSDINADFPDQIASSAVEFDADAMDLNEFMSLLSDDLPNEGTWMQDDDFLDLDMPLLDLGDSATDNFYSQMFEPVSPLPPTADSISELVATPPENGSAKDLGNPQLIDVPSAAENYDEETFYTPNLGDLEAESMPGFWLDTELAAAQHQPLYSDLDLLDRLDGQLQPDLSPALDLADIPAPDFGLDHSMSGLFAATTAKDWSEGPAPIPNAIVAPDRSTTDDDRVDLNEPSEPMSVGNFDLDPQFWAPLEDPSDRVTNGIAPSALDVLFVEEVNHDQLPEPAEIVLEDLIGERLLESMSEQDRVTTELTNWIDDSLAQYNVDDLEEIDLDTLDRESLVDVPIEHNSVNSDVTRSFGTDLEVNAASRDFGDLDLNPFHSNSFTDLDLDTFSSTESLVNLALSDNSIDSVDPAIDSGLDRNLASNAAFTDLDLDFGLDRSDFGDFELNLHNFDELGIDSSIDHSSINLDLDLLNSSELGDPNFDALDLTTPVELAQLNLSSTADLPGDLDLVDRDLGVLNSLELAHPDDAGEMDLNILAETDLDIDGLPSAKFEDLDFNLDEFADGLIDRQLIFDRLELPQANLPDLGNLDALLGIAALGIGVGSANAIGSQSELNDLDALFAAKPADPLDDLDALFAAKPADPLDDLDALFATPAPVAKPPAQKPVRESKDRRAKQSRTFEQTMRVSVRHLNNLNNLVGELVVNRNTLEQDQNRMRQFVEKLLSEVQKLNEVGKRMQDLYERSLMENSLVASRQPSKPTAPNSQFSNEDLAADGTFMEYDPLEMDRFTPIHLLSQKMIELTVRVRESTADIEFVVDGSTEVTRTLRQITGQLQEDLTKSRMVPFAQTADRLQRGVRENGLKYGKQVELSVEGRDTLIDKVILESLTDPLIHMVNNAIAHGIESAPTRQAGGKSSDGKITIRALHQGNQTIISVADDGAGIDTERVKTKAIEKGIITAQQAATMSKKEAYELLFLPSFSTKDQADELAGRGVGMDVVRTSIAEIRGTISTESQLGVGTTFTIRLPLALSIAKALIAVNNKSNIAFPMDGIEDTQDVSPEQIQTNSEGQECIFWRDQLMPFKPLSDLLGFNRPLARNNFYATNEDDSDLVSILILRSDGNFTAVQVDKITGDQEIVIKPLQGPAAKPLGIAGATVMGDGRIIPIADVMELIALAKGTLARHVSMQWTDQITAPTVESRESMVLIVDDSITVRELLSLTFKRAGYRVEQARDGQEAWDKLRAGLPCDIVFCDIEMPRMDGLEFLSRIQKDAALSKVPIAMLTSRGSDRHRQIAAQLGASGYFIKPYLEEALLEAAKRMIGGEVLEIVKGDGVMG